MEIIYNFPQLTKKSPIINEYIKKKVPHSESTNWRSHIFILELF